MVSAQFDYILASGCSWTKGHRGHLESAPATIKRFGYSLREDQLWPALLAKHLGIEYINLGRAGAGNQGIHDSIKAHLMENSARPLVWVLWTEATRFALPSGMTLRPQRAAACNDEKPYGPDNYDKFWQKPDNNLFLNLFIDNFWDTAAIVNQSYSLYYALQRYCEERGLSYLAAQGPHLYQPTLEHTRNITLERKMRNDLRNWKAKRRNTVKVISKNIKDELIMWKLLDETHHPGEKGHQFIARKFYSSVS